MLAPRDAKRASLGIPYEHTSAYQQAPQFTPGADQAVHTPHHKTILVSGSRTSPRLILSCCTYLGKAGCPSGRCRRSDETRRPGRKSSFRQDEGGEVS